VLFFKSVVGEKAESLATLKLKPGQGILGHVARSGETVRVGRAADHPAHDPSIPARLDIRADAVLCVTIAVDEGVVGALALLNKPSGFTESDERLATLIAGQAGRSIRCVATGTRRSSGAARRHRADALRVVHDFRTPLTVISGYTELMATEPDEQQRLQYAGWWTSSSST
jgi:GAF domain-containing protein